MGKRPPRFDLQDQQFGDLLVVGYAGSGPAGAVWWCRCVCGKEVRIPNAALRNGKRTHCGCKSWSDARRLALAEHMRAVAKQAWTPERKAKASASAKASWTDERREKVRKAWAEKDKPTGTSGLQEPSKRKPLPEWTPQRRQEASQRARERLADPGVRAKLSAAVKASWTASRRQDASRRARKAWTPQRRQEAKSKWLERFLKSKRTYKVDAVEPGAKFGQLTVLRAYDLNPTEWVPLTQRNWICECSCGRLSVRQAGRLYSGGVKSCGCKRVSAAERSMEQAIARRASALRDLDKVDREQAMLADKLKNEKDPFRGPSQT